RGGRCVRCVMAASGATVNVNPALYGCQRDGAWRLLCFAIALAFSHETAFGLPPGTAPRPAEGVREVPVVPIPRRQVLRNRGRAFVYHVVRGGAAADRGESDPICVAGFCG